MCGKEWMAARNRNRRRVFFCFSEIAKSDVAARTRRRVAFGANFLVRFFEMDHGSSTTEH